MDVHSSKPNLYSCSVTHSMAGFEEKTSKAIDLYNKDLTIAKMLFDSPCNGKAHWSSGLDRLEDELDELVSNGEIQVSSTTFLFRDKPTKLFRDVGFLIDSQKCEILGLYEKDVHTKAIDISKRPCIWSREIKKYVLKWPHNHGHNVGDKIPVEFDGKYRVSNDSWKVETISELKKHMLSEQLGEAKYNESVVKYNKNCILGLLIDSSRYRENNISKEGMKQDIQAVAHCVRKYIHLDFPVFIIDSITGELTLF